MRPAPAGAVAGPLLPRVAGAALGVVIVAIIIFGVWPSGALGVALDSASTLFQAGGTTAVMR